MNPRITEPRSRRAIITIPNPPTDETRVRENSYSCFALNNFRIVVRAESLKKGSPRVRSRLNCLIRRLGLQIPWHVDDVDPPVPAEEQHCRQHLATLIVQEIMVPMALDHR